MKEEDDRQLTILTGKVMMLELFVRALMTRDFRGDPDPPGRAREAAERAVSLIEGQMPGGASDPATMVIVEQVRTFYDEIVRALEAARHQ